MNLRTFGLRPLIEGRATRHPRERIFNALVLLLWERPALESQELLQLVQGELQTQGASFSELLRAYRDLWSKVNGSGPRP